MGLVRKLSKFEEVTRFSSTSTQSLTTEIRRETKDMKFFKFDEKSTFSPSSYIPLSLQWFNFNLVYQTNQYQSFICYYHKLVFL